MKIRYAPLLMFIVGAVCFFRQYKKEIKKGLEYTQKTQLDKKVK